MDKKQWEVYWGKGFLEHSLPEKPGKELAVNQSFFWEGDYIQILSLYVCSQGLVLDLCQRIEPEAVDAFLNRWRAKARKPEQLTAEEMELLEAENPTAFHFTTKLITDGKPLLRQCSCSGGWYPKMLMEERNPQAEKFLLHYKLDLGFGWMMMRSSFSWADANEHTLKHLEFHFSADPISMAGPHFKLEGEEQSISFTHPITGEKHTLQVKSRFFEEIPEQSFSQLSGDFTCPRYYEAFQFTMTPELREDTYQIRSADARSGPPLSPSDRKSDSLISAAGGLDGPTAVFLAGKRSSSAGNTHLAISSLSFEQAHAKEWAITFRIRTKEDYRLLLDFDRLKNHS